MALARGGVKPTPSYLAGRAAFWTMLLFAALAGDGKYLLGTTLASSSGHSMLVGAQAPVDMIRAHSFGLLW